VGLLDWVLGPSEKDVADEGLQFIRETFTWFESRPQLVDPAFLMAAADPSVAFLIMARNHRLAAAASGRGPRIGYEKRDLDLARKMLLDVDGVESDMMLYAFAYRNVILSFYVSEPTYRALEKAYRELTNLLASHLASGTSSMERKNRREFPMSHVRTITQANFPSEVTQSSKPFLLDFGADWCGPCKQLKPIVETLASKYADQLSVGYCDVGQEQILAGQFGVSSVPTLLFFKGGQVVQQLVGGRSQSELERIIDDIVGA